MLLWCAIARQSATTPSWPGCFDTSAAMAGCSMPSQAMMVLLVPVLVLDWAPLDLAPHCFPPSLILIDSTGGLIHFFLNLTEFLTGKTNTIHVKKKKKAMKISNMYIDRKYDPFYCEILKLQIYHNDCTKSSINFCFFPFLLFKISYYFLFLILFSKYKTLSDSLSMGNIYIYLL